MGLRGDFLKIEDITAFLYSGGNTLVESRKVKINDAGQREREDNFRGERTSLSCGSSKR